MVGTHREAATVILVAADDVPNQPPLILSVKRSSNSNNLPDADVFPGGHFDAADEHVDWLSIIPPDEQHVEFNVKVPVNAPIPTAISSRITAIRETFEECGILLCREYCNIRNYEISWLPINDHRKWRQKIQENAHEFLNLCRTHRCYPDVRNLFLFSNWVSPSHWARHYDCKFFVGIMNHIANGEVDGTEIQSMEWKPASHLIKNENIFLPPPQLHELSRLEKFNDVHSLRNFVLEINHGQCETLISAYLGTRDGLIFFLPGDEMYNKIRGFTGTNKSISNLRGQVMRRLEYQPAMFPARRKNLIIQNYSPERGPQNATFLSSRSKL